SQPWRKPEYMHSHLISANYGFLRTSANIGYIGRLNHAVGPFDLLIKSRYDFRGVQNYFGTGNETVKAVTTRNYYRTFTTRFYVGAGLSKRLGQFQSIDLSAFYRNIKVQRVANHFSTTDHGIDTSLFGNNQFAGAEASYRFRKVN